jgi:hypothetical protein
MAAQGCRVANGLPMASSTLERHRAVGSGFGGRQMPGGRGEFKSPFDTIRNPCKSAGVFFVLCRLSAIVISSCGVVKAELDG